MVWEYPGRSWHGHLESKTVVLLLLLLLLLLHGCHGRNMYSPDTTRDDVGPKQESQNTSPLGTPDSKTTGG